MVARLGIDGAEDDSFGDGILPVFIPESGGDLGVVTSRGASLTTSALFEVLGILALPDTLGVPEVLDEDFGAVHELLSIGRVEGDGTASPAQMRAVLPSLIHDHTQVKLGVDLLKLSHRLVVVQTEDVHRRRDLELSCQIEEKVETQVLQRSGLRTCVRILVVLPAHCYEGLSESEAPEDLRLSVILSEDAVVLTGLSRHEWALISCKSRLICINELFPGIGNFWVC